METYKYKYGLSLVEMLIVVGVIAVLASLVIGIAARIDNQSKERCLKTTLALLEEALREYYDYYKVFPDPNQQHSPSYPTHSAALYGQLYETPSSRKILDKISDSLIKNSPGTLEILQIHDPWGTVLNYKYVPGNTFPELISAGPDKEFNSADDISNK
jgi:prepilin-type N-terminal cleavage/methylation domain-containing protein